MHQYLAGLMEGARSGQPPKEKAEVKKQPRQPPSPPSNCARESRVYVRNGVFNCFHMSSLRRLLRGMGYAWQRRRPPAVKLPVVRGTEYYFMPSFWQTTAPGQPRYACVREGALTTDLFALAVDEWAQELDGPTPYRSR